MPLAGFCLTERFGRDVLARFSIVKLGQPNFWLHRTSGPSIESASEFDEMVGMHLDQSDDFEPRVPRIVSRDRTELSAWVTLETISVARDASVAPDLYHAFYQADYVHVLTMTAGGAFLLVRQFRPVIERWTLELPGGLRDSGEHPESTAVRELKEETGFAITELVPLIEAHADVGRLCNKFFGFFAVAEQISEAESGIDPVLVTGKGLQNYAASGMISTPAHIGLLYLAAIHPRIRELCCQSGYSTVPWMT